MPIAPPNNSTRPENLPISIWYEDQGDPSAMPLLLIMGLSSQLIAWPKALVDDLVSRGFRVIRLDNRDCGLSTHLDGVPPNPEPILHPENAPYFLRNMADDAASLLTHLGIEKAHVVGASMGGMIAQLLTLNHPTQVSSLCSIMSTTGNLLVGQPTQEAYDAVSKPVPPEREAAIEHIVWVQGIIGSQTHPLDPEEARRQAGEAYDRAFYPEGTQRQTQAILAAPDRSLRLPGVGVPTLVIHGREDSLINISGGQATANLIPGAVFLPLDGMGHDLPPHLWTTFADAIEENARKAGA